MNIYKLSEKEFREKKKAFYQTPYGKRIVCTYFIIPFIGMLITIELLIQTIICYAFIDSSGCMPFFMSCLIVPLIFSAILTLLSYVLANKAYYHEFKEYILSLKSKKE